MLPRYSRHSRRRIDSPLFRSPSYLRVVTSNLAFVVCFHRVYIFHQNIFPDIFFSSFFYPSRKVMIVLVKLSLLRQYIYPLTAFITCGTCGSCYPSHFFASYPLPSSTGDLAPCVA